MIKKTKKNRNRHSLINIERLNMKIENAFWSGLMVGAIGVITTLWLMSDKSEKKETVNN
jgi:hypothetical protein